MFSNFILSFLSGVLGAILFYEYKYLPLKGNFEQLESIYKHMCDTSNGVVSHD